MIENLRIKLILTSEKDLVHKIIIHNLVIKIMSNRKVLSLKFIRINTKTKESQLITDCFRTF